MTELNQIVICVGVLVFVAAYLLETILVWVENKKGSIPEWCIELARVMYFSGAAAVFMGVLARLLA